MVPVDALLPSGDSAFVAKFRETFARRVPHLGRTILHDSDSEPRLPAHGSPHIRNHLRDERRRVVARGSRVAPRDERLAVLIDDRRGADGARQAVRDIHVDEGRHRTVTIEEAVVPLLDAIKDELGDSGPLVPDMPSERGMARGLRRWLSRADVDRHELHHRTPTTRPLRFHDLRATGITWMAVRGDDPLKIRHRAGHTDFETTQRYIRMAQALAEGFGDPFPELPPDQVSHAAIACAFAN